jgi:hypothetical protein
VKLEIEVTEDEIRSAIERKVCTAASWQPRTTVPTDTRILLAMRGGEVKIGQQASTSSANSPERRWRFDDSPGLLTNYPSGLGPTHWMPLPPLPQEEQP